MTVGAELSDLSVALGCALSTVAELAAIFVWSLAEANGRASFLVVDALRGVALVLGGLGALLLALVMFLALQRDRREAAERRTAPLETAAPMVSVVVTGDIVSTLESSVIQFFTGILTGIENFFGTIFQSFANLVSDILKAPVDTVTASFQTLTNSTLGFGPFAPVVVAAVIAATVLIVIWLLWTVIKFSTSETEQTANEVEEGV